MNSISFTPQLSAISPVLQTKRNLNNKNNKSVEQKSQITELSSFRGYIPAEENKKCRTMLRIATYNGAMRFLTNDEIHLMLDAIKGFKSKNKKTDLLYTLLYYKTDNHIEYSKLTAGDIAEYFVCLSGAPRDVQKIVAQKLGEAPSREAAKEIMDLYKNGKIKGENS